MKPMIRTIAGPTLLALATLVLAGCGLQAVPSMPTETTSLIETPAPPESPVETPVATDTPVNPAVAISPVSGPPGTSVQVAAKELPPNAMVEIGVGRQDSEYDVIGTADADGEGQLSVQVAMPEYATPGERWVVVVTTSEPAAKAVSNVFEVTELGAEASVAISPQSGPVGTQVQVTATGFPPEVPVKIGFGRPESEYDVLKTAQTDADGEVDIQIAIPEFADPEDTWLLVVATTDGAITELSDPFDVTPVVAEPEISITPQAGAVGTQIQVTAMGLPAETPVDIGFGRVDSEYDVLKTAETDADGKVDIQIEVPSFAEPEDPWVVVVATQDRAVTLVSDVFDVLALTPTPSPTRTGGLFTQVNIYLIAVGDAGQQGELIGCDDSVIPVQVEIEPTIAPLRAALNELLAIDTQYYGQSGLYNALYQSDLSIVGINIVQGKATIALSGTLQIGGVCDAPRVEAQLKETALQFSTVNDVEVTVNGQPLEEVLSNK
ncbi:MAG: GerMN domain-containing protein [Anaerolineae bacterium]